MDALLIETEHFLTAFYAIIDIDTFTCRYCSAGHPPQMLVRASGGVELLATTGFFVGMFEGAEYEEAQIQLEPGDRLALYTDGLIETLDAHGRQFGRENLARLLTEYGQLSVQDVTNSILSDLIVYMAEPSFQDDVTVLIAEVMESL